MRAAEVGFPGPDDCVRYDTTRQRNTHVTEIRCVLYRWHPWHGREVFIFGSKTKNERAVFRCALNQTDARVLEIPQWMFDAATCCRMTLSAVPSISVRSLRELARLLSVIGSTADSDVVKAKLLSLPDAGGACATEEPGFLRSAGAVSCSHGDSGVDESSGGGSRADLAMARETLAGSLSRPRRSRTGGGSP
jgi:hypothetical protein